jgi:hypothetical protein
MIISRKVVLSIYINKPDTVLKCGARLQIKLSAFPPTCTSKVIFSTLHSPVHRIEIGQKLHSWVKSVPECQPTSGMAAMLKATKPEDIL